MDRILMDRKSEKGKPVLDPGLVNATKKTAPTAAARIRSTSKVCIFNLLCFSTALLERKGAARPAQPKKTRRDLPPTVHMERLTMTDATLRVGIWDHIDLAQ